MGLPIKFLIDTSGEETTTRALNMTMTAKSYTCGKHGDVGSRVFSLEIKDGQEVVSTGVICIECLASMLRCCRVEQDDDASSEKSEEVER
jgi:hypothetical protein